MAWFESGLSSLKGQLSNLTKEVKEVLTQPDSDEEVKAEDDDTASNSNRKGADKKPRVNLPSSESEEFLGQRSQNSTLGAFSGDSSEQGAFVDDDGDDGWDVEGWAVQDTFHVPSSTETGQGSSEIDELKAEIKKLREEKQQLTQTVTALETELETITQIVSRNNRNARQFEELQAEVVRLQNENGRLNREKLELEQIVAASQDENSNLSTGIELDLQHQRDLEQLIAAKDSTQRKYNQLKEDYDIMKSQFEEFRQIRVKTTSTASQSSYDCASVLSQTCDEISSAVASTSSQTTSDNPSSSSQTVNESSSMSSQTTIQSVGASSQTVNDNPSASSQTSGVSSSFAASQTTFAEVSNVDGTRRHTDSESSEEECSFRDLKNVLDSVPFKIPEQFVNKTPDDGSKIIQDIKALTSMCLNLQENEKKLAAELMEKSEEVFSLRAKVEEATKKMTLVEEELADFEQKETDWQETEQKQKEEIAKLVEAHATSVKAEQDLNTELTRNKSKIEELETQKAALEANLEQLQSIAQSNNSHEELRSELMSKIADQDNQISALTEARTDLESEVRLLNDHVKDLTYRLQMSEATTLNQNNLETETNNLKVGLESAKRTIVTLNEQLSSASIDINKKTELINGQTELIEDLRQQIENSTKEHQSQAELNLKLSEEIAALKQNLSSKEQELKSIEEDYAELKLSHEKKDRELCKYILEEKQLKDELNALKKKCEAIESEKIVLTETCDSLTREVVSLQDKASTKEHTQDQIQKHTQLEKDLEQRQHDYENVKEKLKQIELENTELREENNRLNEMLSLEEDDLETLKSKVSDLEDFAQKCQDYEELNEKLKRLVTEHDELLKDNSRLNEIISQSADEIAMLKEGTQILENIKSENEKLVKTNSDLMMDLQKLNENYSNLKSDLSSKSEELVNLKLVAESYEVLKTKYESLEMAVNKLMNEIADKDAEISNFKKSNSTSQSVLNEISTLKSEKEQLIQSLQVKHSESVGYHSELQRINGLLEQELAEKQELEKAVKVTREQLDGNEKVLKARDKEIDLLKEQIQTLQTQLEYVSQLLRVADRQEAEGEPDIKQKSSDSDDRNQILQKIEILQEEKNSLNCALEAEQNKCKTMYNALREEKEKNQGLKNDLERLKSHLVSVEETYTQELMNAEKQIEELQTRLSSADERVKSSSTAYTSASIRANQQVESLTNQVKVLTEQRELIQQKLNEAEDQVQSHGASLTNLQIVLEQFQIDKEKDILLATERIQENLQAAYRKNNQLCSEISTLQTQLSEANEGLKAAARFTDQLNAKSRTIETLEKQVAELKAKLSKAEAKIDAVSRGTESKIDRCLVRNLVVGYLSAPINGRTQALNVLATVLDMSKEDKQRVGLEPGGNASHFQSLSEAFIKFLENESQPQNVLKMIPENKSNTNVTAHRRSPSGSVLLSEASLPNIPQFPVNRNSGSILKDVMKNDR
nr:PREDICTED: thyroid receptor-interacting protein 11-like isoform X2 [Bemisia tabaci]